MEGGKKEHISDFERGMVVGARRAGPSVSLTADLLGFSPWHNHLKGFLRKREYPVRGSCVEEKVLLMLGQRRKGRRAPSDKWQYTNFNNRLLQPVCKYAESHDGLLQERSALGATAVS